MKKQLLKLLGAAGFHQPEIERLGIEDKFEKFAELIVQEMHRLLEQYYWDSFPEDTVDDFDKGYLAGLHTAQKAVKKHFGVSE